MNIRIDVTDPTNIFRHKGGARKGHKYLVIRCAVSRGMDSKTFCEMMREYAYILPN